MALPRVPLDRIPLVSSALGLDPGDPHRFDGATVLVTGASSGIGAELAREAAATAGTLVLVARRRDRLDELADALRAVSRPGHDPLDVDVRPADLSSRDEVTGLVRDVVAAHGGVDVLVNCAGFGAHGLFDAGDPELYERMIAVNVTATTLLTRAFLPQMVERGFGGVLMVGSMVGRMTAPGSALYSATKYFVDGLSQTLRAELDGTGVVLTQVAPGPVTSEFDEVAGQTEAVGDAVDALRIDARECAREAWEGFLAARPLVLPGARYRALMRAQATVPAVAVRPAMAAAGRRLRRGRL